jgi:hypothetical protein
VATVLVPAPPLPVEALLDVPPEPEAVLLVVVAVGVPLAPSSDEEQATRRNNGSMLAKKTRRTFMRSPRHGDPRPGPLNDSPMAPIACRSESADVVFHHGSA